MCGCDTVWVGDCVGVLVRAFVRFSVCVCVCVRAYVCVYAYASVCVVFLIDDRLYSAILRFLAQTHCARM